MNNIKNNILFSICFLVISNNCFSEIIDIGQVKDKYINLTKDNQNKYFYIIDYNQKQSTINDKIIKDIKKFNKDINIRYIPIATGNQNLCFHKKDDIFYIDKNNCEKINTYFYNNESSLPIVIFSDNQKVNIATNIDYKVINEYFGLLDKESQELENKRIKEINLKTDTLINKINKDYYLKYKFLNYYNKYYFYSFYCFGKPVIKVKVKEITPSLLKNKKQIESKVVNSIKPVNENELNINFPNFFNPFKINKEFCILKNNYNIYNETKFNEEMVKELESVVIVKNKNKPKIVRTKLLSKEVLNNGIIVYNFSTPPIKKVNIKWNQPKPVPVKNETKEEVDPNIQIINN